MFKNNNFLMAVAIILAAGIIGVIFLYALTDLKADAKQEQIPYYTDSPDETESGAGGQKQVPAVTTGGPKSSIEDIYDHTLWEGE